jgi:hypothetical protein
MAERRPDIPRPLEREVLVEAGHRCAIPTCRSVPVELAHIIPWATVKEHTFDNLIALCPTCHTRYDNGDIDRKAMQQYKVNLGVLTSRYGDLEQRVLEQLASSPPNTYVPVPGGLDILLMYLLRDGIIEEYYDGGLRMRIGGTPTTVNYILTPKGREFVEHWREAQEL